MDTSPSIMVGNYGKAYLVGLKWYDALSCIQKGSDELFINKVLQGKGKDLIHNLNLGSQTLIYNDNDKCNLKRDWRGQRMEVSCVIINHLTCGRLEFSYFLYLQDHLPEEYLLF